METFLHSLFAMSFSKWWRSPVLPVVLTLAVTGAAAAATPAQGPRLEVRADRSTRHGERPGAGAAGCPHSRAGDLAGRTGASSSSPRAPTPRRRRASGSRIPARASRSAPPGRHRGPRRRRHPSGVRAAQLRTSRGGLIVFQNLVFAQRRRRLRPMLSPGVTVDAARPASSAAASRATPAAGTDGGGVKTLGSAAISRSARFTGNSSPLAGGAMMIHAQRRGARRHFLDNRVNLPGSDPSSQVARSACSTARARLGHPLPRQPGGLCGRRRSSPLVPGPPLPRRRIPRCLSPARRSRANPVAPQPCCPPPGPPTGGAVHVEAQTALDVEDRSFADNHAQFGGALDGFRALVGVAGSTLRGNSGSLTGATRPSAGRSVRSPRSRRQLDLGRTEPPRRGDRHGIAPEGPATTGGGPAANAGGCVYAPVTCSSLRPRRLPPTAPWTLTGRRSRSPAPSSPPATSRTGAAPEAGRAGPSAARSSR